MNIKVLVKITNILAILGILLLIYWVFGFILITVFGLKVFERNLTEIFGLSVLGILAVLAGALILNIMLNLTRIADDRTLSHAVQPTVQSTTRLSSKYFIILALVLFPVIAGGLYLGDYRTRQNKFTLMQISADQVMTKYHDSLDFLGRYRFDKAWIDQVNAHIDLLQATNSTIKQAIIIMPDMIGDEVVYLAFGRDHLPSHIGEPNAFDVAQGNVARFEEGDANIHSVVTTEAISLIDGVNTKHSQDQKRYYKKSDFIFTSDTTKNETLTRMFGNTEQSPSLSAYDGNYEMFYPYQVDGKTVAVLYLSDYMAYGKGSY